jgi:hypothetical protein
MFLFRPYFYSKSPKEPSFLPNAQSTSRAWDETFTTSKSEASSAVEALLKPNFLPSFKIRRPNQTGSVRNNPKKIIPNFSSTSKSPQASVSRASFGSQEPSSAKKVEFGFPAPGSFLANKMMGLKGSSYKTFDSQSSQSQNMYQNVARRSNKGANLLSTEETEDLLRQGNFKKLNAPTLIHWLRQKGIPCKAKDKKDDLISKAQHFLNPSEL